MRKALLCVCATGLLLIGARSEALGAITMNNGVLVIPPDESSIGDFLNTGTMFINAGGTFTTNGKFLNQNGTVNIAAGGVLELASQGLEIIGGSVNTLGAGLVLGSGGGSLAASAPGAAAAASIGGTPILGGVIPAGMNIIVRQFLPFPQFPQFAQPGSLNLMGDQITTNNGSVELDGALASFIGFESVTTNNGTIKLRNGHNLNHTGLGLFLQNGDLEVLGGSTLTLNPTSALFQVFSPTANLFVDSTSTLVAAAGVVLNAGTATIDGTVQGNVDTAAGFVLDGGGKVVGRLTNNGTFRIGNSPGDFEVDGLYQQLATGVTEFEINGVAPGQFDQIIAVNATLGGTLKLIFGPGIDLPSLIGQEWVLFDVSGVLNGEFDDVTIMGVNLGVPTPNPLDPGPTVFLGRKGNARLWLEYGPDGTQDVVLVVNDVPEPASLALLALGAAMIGSPRRRRR